MTTEQASFSGKIVVITGASRGIGAALAIQLGALGAQCVLVARTVGGLEATDDAIRKAGGKAATLVPLDLIKDPDKIDALGAELFSRYGHIDYLIGNAGQLGGLSPLGHFEPKLWNETFALNVTANYRLLRSFDLLLRQSKAGRAAFITCTAARQPEAFWGAYCASKAALEAMVACYAAEMVSTSVRAVCINPGTAATKLYKTAYPGHVDTTLPSADAAAAKIVAALSAL
jgi:NAD(P)-dependent dehydrogenase (short-subunit alcohol dehydrogenase family)